MNTCVRDVMTKSPITIDPEAPLETAVATMREREVRHLPVVDETGRLMGMVTDRDLREVLLAPVLTEHLSSTAQRRLLGLGAAFANLRVRDAMTWDAVTIGPEAPIARAAALMFEGRIGCLLVVEGARLVGIVTERDVLRVLAATLPAVRGNDPDNYLW